MTKAIKMLALLLPIWVAACTSTTIEDTNQPDSPDDGGFVSSDTAPDATPRELPAENGSPSISAEPLTNEESQDVLALVNELPKAEDARRAEILNTLVANGPRYLPTYRDLSEGPMALDMLRIIQRIETAHPDSVVKNTPDAPPPNTVKNAGEEPLKVTPKYPWPQGSYDRDQVEAFMADRLSAAKAMLKGGNHKGAKEVARAALILLPDTRLRSDFEALIVNADNEGQADLIISGRLRLTPEHLHFLTRKRNAPFTSPLQITCFLKNVSSDPITLVLGRGDNHALVALDVALEQTDYAGTSIKIEQKVNLPVTGQESVTIDAGKAFSFSVQLPHLNDIDPNSALKYTLSKVQVKANLRVVEARDADGKPMVLRPVRFPQESILLFPSDYDLKASLKAPVKQLRDALNQRSPQDVYMTSLLVPSKSLRSATDAVLDSKHDDKGLALTKARSKSLFAMHGIGAAWGLKQWREWWKDNRFRVGQ